MFGLSVRVVVRVVHMLYDMLTVVDTTMAKQKKRLNNDSHAIITMVHVGQQ